VFSNARVWGGLRREGRTHRLLRAHCPLASHVPTDLGMPVATCSYTLPTPFPASLDPSPFLNACSRAARVPGARGAAVPELPGQTPAGPQEDRASQSGEGGQQQAGHRQEQASARLGGGWHAAALPACLVRFVVSRRHRQQTLKR